MSDERRTGRSAASKSSNVIFSSEPFGNTIFNIRSFSHSPQRVSAFVSAPLRPSRTQFRESGEQSGHLDRGLGGFFADVVTAGGLGPAEGLVEVLGGEDAEHDRHAGLEGDLPDAARALAGDKLEV